MIENLYDNPYVGKEVLVRAKGFAPKRVKVQTGAPDKPAELTIALEPGHRLTGRVIDDKGQPITGVLVRFDNNKSSFSEYGWGETDAQGQFTFDSLPPNCFFGFSKLGFSQIKGRELAFDTDQIATIAMAPAGVIIGKVADAKSGTPVRAFYVRVMFSPIHNREEPSFGPEKVIIDAGHNHQSRDGLFRLQQLIVGMPVEVAVKAEGYEPHIFEGIVIARPDNAQVTKFPLEPLIEANLRAYAGRLLDSLGKPVAGAQVRLIATQLRDADKRTDFPFNWEMVRSDNLADHPAAARFLAAVTDDRGRFRFTQIPRSSEVELVIWGQGIAPRRVDHLELNAENASESIEMRARTACANRRHRRPHGIPWGHFDSRQSQ